MEGLLGIPSQESRSQVLIIVVHETQGQALGKGKMRPVRAVNITEHLCGDLGRKTEWSWGAGETLQPGQIIDTKPEEMDLLISLGCLPWLPVLDSNSI